MQDLNDLEKRQQGMPQMPTMPAGKQTSPQVPPQGKKAEQAAQVPAEGERLLEIRRYKMSKYEKFFCIAIVIMLFVFTLVGYIFIIKDDMKAKEQIQASYERAKNSSQVQEYRAKQAQRQRELAKKRRLKELGIEGSVEPYQKNDLLNEKLREQEIAQVQEQELLEKEKIGPDYREELAAYNARLQEIKQQKEKAK